MIPKKVFLPPPSLWTPFANQPNATMITFLSDRLVASERPQQTRRPRDNLIAAKSLASERPPQTRRATDKLIAGDSSNAGDHDESTARQYDR